jgi:formylglycine-generating enzyme
MLVNRVLVSHFSFFVVCFLLPLPATAVVSINWTHVGDPGNLPDPMLSGEHSTGNGAVAYEYNISRFEVTNEQYSEFLNAKDRDGTNQLGLYYIYMTESSSGGIDFDPDGEPGGKYSPIPGTENRPVISVTWYSAIRFANWLNNGQGSGDTESGAYTLGALDSFGTPVNGNSITRNVGAKIFIPSEDEWYKAAYYNPATNSYYLYATSSNDLPNRLSPPGDNNSANYSLGVPNVPTNVGAYIYSVSPYGTYDQSGNVWEWNELLVDGRFREARGGSFGEGSSFLSSYTVSGGLPDVHFITFGFRVAEIPEPASMLHALCGFAGIALLCSRRPYFL